MFEVAWADHDIEDTEILTMTALLTRLFGLSAERVAEIVAATRTNHDKSVGVYPFTRALNEQLDADEKSLASNFFEFAVGSSSGDHVPVFLVRGY